MPEYLEVLERLHVRSARTIVSLIREQGQFVRVTEQIRDIPDRDDAAFCECAESANADFLVTLPSPFTARLPATLGHGGRRAGVLALVGVVVGGLALARSIRRLGNGGRLGATVALVAHDWDASADGPVRFPCGSQSDVPPCEWQPEPHDAWNCNPGGCGHSWNTFETRGVCPACSRGWTETACLRCSVWSPHDDWYVEKE